MRYYNEPEFKTIEVNKADILTASAEASELPNGNNGFETNFDTPILPL